MFEGHHHLVCELLAATGLVGPEAWTAAVAEQAATGRPIADLVLERGWVDRDALLGAVAAHLGTAYVADLPPAISEDLRPLIDPGLARRLGIIPVERDGSRLTVAAIDPLAADLAGDLAFALGGGVRLVVADPETVARLLHHHYREEQGGAPPGPPVGDTAAAAPAEPVLTEADIEQMAGKTPVVRFVNGILAQAIREKASDVHFEPFEGEFKIRQRIDGVLRDLPPPPRSLALPVVSRLKVLANLNIAERRRPQDGRIRLTLAGRSVDLRVSTLPTQFGESVVLRVLDQSSVQLDLGQIGLGPLLPQVEAVIRRPNGIFIVTGPTGSGKTTTLYSCLKALNQVEAKLLAVEDPVEYEIEGVMQVPVNLAAGLTFARALRTFLRQDPDIVMVGEIRDLETAQIAIQASLTGHLVLTTLHTNDAASAVTRLTDMGIEPFLLASTLEGVLAQRLVRRICPRCRTMEPQPVQGWVPEGGEVRPTEYRGAGCPDCRHSGYQGRRGIFEFLRMTDPLRDLVVQGAALSRLRQTAIAEGMVPLREAGLQAMAAGETTADEVGKYV